MALTLRAASHDAAATLSTYSGGGGSGVTVDNTVDAPFSASTIVAPGATESGAGEATLAAALADVLAVSNDVNGNAIVSANDGADSTGASIVMTPAAGPIGGEIALQGGAGNVDGEGNGGSASIRGGASYNYNPASIDVEGGVDQAPGGHGRVMLKTANSNGPGPLVSDGTYVTYSQAAFVANGSTVDQLRDALIAAGLMAAS